MLSLEKNEPDSVALTITRKLPGCRSKSKPVQNMHTFLNILRLNIFFTYLGEGVHTGKWTLSQGRICRCPPSRSEVVRFYEDAECAE